MKADVNFIKHINETFRRFEADSRSVASHRMLYLALFDCWNRSYFRTTISICREEVMRIAGIGSTKTYYRCMNDLDAWGYISYKPSKNIYARSKITMSRFDSTDDSTGDQPVTPSLNHSNLRLEPETEAMGTMMGRFDSTDDLTGDQLVTPSLNNSNLRLALAGDIGNMGTMMSRIDTTWDQPVTPSINNSNLRLEPEGGPEGTLRVVDNSKSLDWLTEDDTTPRPDDDDGLQWTSKYIPDREVQPPSLEEVVEFFRERRFEARDARIFFKYHEALGWVGKRKVPITDWQLYARCWIGHIAQSLLWGSKLVSRTWRGSVVT